MKATYKKPNIFLYRFIQAAGWLLSVFVFRKKTLRNEIRGVKGAYVLLANHEAQFDVANIVCATSRPMTFVASNSFYNSLPIHGIMEKLAVIPKQQFQTSLSEMKKIKAVIDSGNPLTIYPAGLMCEDGLSTPIPRGTYEFLRWLDADVYIAKTSGTYFTMPKWTKGLRPGRTYMDIYRLFTKEELRSLSIEEIKKRADDALLFDAYREQESLRCRYAKNDNIEGLQNVLYMCPHCENEFTMGVKNKHSIFCESCGYEEQSDKYAFLHVKSKIGKEIRYVSDWSRRIFQKVKEDIKRFPDLMLKAETRIDMIDYEKHKFIPVGEGTLSLTGREISLNGMINGEALNVSASTANYPTLPFSPGKYVELQVKDKIYRCVLNDGRLAQKFINTIKALYELKFQQ